MGSSRAKRPPVRTKFDGGVVALRQAPADVGVDVLLAVHPVPPEALAQVDHRGGAVGPHERVELDHDSVRRHGRKSRVSLAPSHTGSRADPARHEDGPGPTRRRQSTSSGCSKGDVASVAGRWAIVDGTDACPVRHADRRWSASITQRVVHGIAATGAGRHRRSPPARRSSRELSSSNPLSRSTASRPATSGTPHGAARPTPAPSR